MDWDIIVVGLLAALAASGYGVWRAKGWWEAQTGMGKRGMK